MSSNRKLQRLAVVAVGATVTCVMVVLGLWQMQVFRDQGKADALARTQLPPVPIEEQLGKRVEEAYGRPVRVQGTFIAADQLLVDPASGSSGFRVLQPLKLTSGKVIPVVRGGIAASSDVVPFAPAEQVDVVGLLLPSEPDVPATSTSSLGSIRLPRLAQTWPHDLVPGYLLLQPGQPGSAGLSAVTYRVPETEGNLRNGGYALQWWVFAAFAVAFTVAVWRSLGKKESDDRTR